MRCTRACPSHRRSFPPYRGPPGHRPRRPRTPCRRRRYRPCPARRKSRPARASAFPCRTQSPRPSRPPDRGGKDWRGHNRYRARRRQGRPCRRRPNPRRRSSRRYRRVRAPRRHRHRPRRVAHEGRRRTPNMRIAPMPAPGVESSCLRWFRSEGCSRDREHPDRVRRRTRATPARAPPCRDRER